MSRGGRREGAGRPQRNTARVVVGLNDEELETLDAFVELRGLLSRSEGVRVKIRDMRRAIQRAERTGA